MQEMEFTRSACAAAQAGDVARLATLIERNPGCVHHDGTGERTGYTPLHYAARNGHAECVALLLRSGASVLARTAAGRATPLHRAAYAGRAEVCKALVRAGAPVDAQDADGETALHKAASQGFADLLATLSDACPAAEALRNRHGKRADELGAGGSAGAGSERAGSVGSRSEYRAAYVEPRVLRFAPSGISLDLEQTEGEVQRFGDEAMQSAVWSGGAVMARAMQVGPTRTPDPAQPRPSEPIHSTWNPRSPGLDPDASRQCPRVVGSGRVRTRPVGRRHSRRARGGVRRVWADGSQAGRAARAAD